MSAGVASQPSSRAEWLWMFILSIGSFGLGWYGVHTNDEQRNALSDLSEAYHALQFFALHGEHLHDGEHGLPWQLHAGRIGAAIMLFWAVLKVAGSALVTRAYLARQVWRPGHIVVCGLGHLGLPIAMEAKRQGQRVIAIERNENSEGARRARSSGIPVLAGNASDRRVLLRAYTRTASRIWALTNDDDVNVGVAAIAGSIRRYWFSPELICRPLVAESRLRESLRHLPSFAERTSRYRVETGPDLLCLRARHAFAIPDRALDHVPVPRDGYATLVLVGFGRMGEAIALQAARIAHFDSTAAKHLRLLFVVDENAQCRVDQFKDRFRKLDRFCDSVELGSIEDRSVRQQIVKECRAAHSDSRPISIAFCYDEDNGRNLSLALELAAMLPNGRANLLVYLDINCGFTRLLREERQRHREVDSRIHAFGMLEEIWTFDALENERDDLLAQRFHDAYLADRAAARATNERKGEPYQPRPAEVSWTELPEFFRDSNRAIADHVPVKMRALGYELARVAERGDSDRVKEFHAGEMDRLAEMEHRRWCAFLWIHDWEHGPKAR